MYAILSQSPLFAGMSRAEMERALEFFSARQAVYCRGEYLIRAGDPLPSFGLVLSGRVQVSMDDLSGDRMIMASVCSPGTFGEALHYLARPKSDIYATAEADTAVLWMDASRLRTASPAMPFENRKALENFLSLLCSRSLSMNDRIQILSKRSIRKKLLAFFSQQVRSSGSMSFALDFDRSSMADYLGVERSALSRELSRMKRAGIIDFRKNRFTIVNASLLE